MRREREHPMRVRAGLAIGRPSMKVLWLKWVMVFALTFLANGCMLMHGGDMMGHGSHHQARNDSEVAEAGIEQGESEARVENPPVHSEHEKESESRETVNPWLIWGGVGMGLMMVLMFI